MVLNEEEFVLKQIGNELVAGLSMKNSKKKLLNIYTMSTIYHPFQIALTDGQKKTLQKAYVTKEAVNLKVKPDQIGRRQGKEW